MNFTSDTRLVVKKYISYDAPEKASFYEKILDFFINENKPYIKNKSETLKKMGKMKSWAQ